LLENIDDFHNCFAHRLSRKFLIMFVDLIRPLEDLITLQTRRYTLSCKISGLKNCTFSVSCCSRCQSFCQNLAIIDRPMTSIQRSIQ